MDTARFDAFARLLAAGSTRRRLIQGLAIAGIGRSVTRPDTGFAATREECEAVTCPQGWARACNYSMKTGECTGCYCIKPSSGGIVGGGLIRADDGNQAHLSLMASRTRDASDPELIRIEGQMHLSVSAWEGIDLQLDALQITGYGPTEGVEGGRDVHGWMHASAVDQVVPFFMQVVDAGGPGSWRDTVSLLVGDSVPIEAVLGATAETIGFSYALKGSVESGDLALVEFGDGGETVPGTPTP